MKKPSIFMWYHSEIYRQWFMKKYCKNFDSDESIWLFNNCSWYKENMLRKLISELKSNEHSIAYHEENMKVRLHEVERYLANSKDSKNIKVSMDTWNDLSKLIENMKEVRSVIQVHIFLLSTKLENMKILNQSIPEQVEFNIQKIKEHLSQIEKFKLANI